MWVEEPGLQTPPPNRPQTVPSSPAVRVAGDQGHGDATSSVPPRVAEADSKLDMKDVKDRYYQLPIPRENIYLLASQEDLARHKDALLQKESGSGTLALVSPTAPAPSVQGGVSLKPGLPELFSPPGCGPCRAELAPTLTPAYLCLQPQQVVGVDLEWTPVFIAGGRPRPSLLQVAMEGCVFLLYILAFTQPPAGQGAQAFSQLVTQLLSDPFITKLEGKQPEPLPNPFLHTPQGGVLGAPGVRGNSAIPPHPFLCVPGEGYWVHLGSSALP
ncbi:hypothetical protein P7K49_002214 [Saguinus oedipus]|uniref:Uncharacterized protein n=1 Tax=Saguinus oedipus TaxID=9490 RepID=A0ABQ9WGR1_SAGOE|nr:hypothetical protein P7K49_002214 [Saguinus oedipus]